jgi:glycosyltransferase involved in cell wall biosynthesis
MKKKKILFYIQVPFMDVNLEIIKTIKDEFDVHVLIELPATMLHANIFDLNINLNEYDPITSFWDVSEKWGISYLSEYFKGCGSVNFAIYKPGSKKALFDTTFKLISHIRAQRFDRLQFDDFSARQAFLLPFINLKDRLILSIHDPLPHKGEFEWKRFIIRKLFYDKAIGYFTYSNFSKNELQKRLKPNSRVFDLQLPPYTVFKKFSVVTKAKLEEDMYISFVGRLSPYKGIDLFMQALQAVLQEFPTQKFIIAGRPTFGYIPDFTQLGALTSSITIIDRHLTNEEMVGIISKSKLVVCPYLEATQSGVVMTAHALGCPVLVTNTGGLAEGVMDYKTGLIAPEITSQAIAGKMIEFLRSDLYKGLHDYIISDAHLSDIRQANLDKVRLAYA